MKKINLLFSAVIILSSAFTAKAQVNIGSNTSPNADATLELTSGGTKGLLLPRVALSSTTSISPMTHGPFASLKGMTVYNTATAGSGISAVSPGLYYCDGTQWIRIIGTTGTNDKNFYDGDGTLLSNRTVSLTDKNLNFSSTTGNLLFSTGSTGKVGIGTNTPASLMSVSGGLAVGSTYAGTNAAPTNGAIIEGGVAIGTTAANTSADLTLGSTNKGFLPNKVSLTSTTDASTVVSPATGLIVYNTNPAMTNGYGTGLYMNTGTGASPIWGQLAVTSPAQGSTVAKVIYTGTAGDLSKTVTVGNFVFRFTNAGPGSSLPQMALTAPQNLSVYAGVNQQYDNANHNGYEYNNATVSFNTSNYSTFQNIIGSTIANFELNVIHITDVTNNNYYRVTFYISGAGSPNYTWSIVAEKF